MSVLLGTGKSVAPSKITTTVASRRKVTVNDKVNLGTDQGGATTLTSKLSDYYTKNFASELTTAITKAGLSGITVGTVSGVTVTQTTGAGGGAVNTGSASSSGLAGWAIALIIIACILCIAITGGVVYYMMAGNKKHQPTNNVTIHKDPATHSETLDSAVQPTMGSSSQKDILPDRVPPNL
jgi:hypothetical protein